MVAGPVGSRLVGQMDDLTGHVGAFVPGLRLQRVGGEADVAQGAFDQQLQELLTAELLVFASEIIQQGPGSVLLLADKVEVTVLTVLRLPDDGPVQPEVLAGGAEAEAGLVAGDPLLPLHGLVWD